MKRNNRKFIKDYWSKSGVSTTKIIVTAIAAVSMAYVSSKLYSMTDSIMIAGIVSATSLILNELYNFVFQWVHFETKNLTVAAKITARKTKEQTDTPTNKEDTAELEIDSENLLQKTETKPLDPENIPSQVEIRESEKDSRNVFRKVGDFFNRHNNIRLILFFFMVSMVTLGINYLMPNTEKIEYQQSNTTIERTIDEETKKSIIDEASETALSKVEHPDDKEVIIDGKTVEKEIIIDGETAEEVKETSNNVNSLSESNNNLTEKHDDLQSSYSSLLQDFQKQAEEIKNLNTQITDMKLLIADLQTRLDAIENDGQQLTP